MSRDLDRIDVSYIHLYVKLDCDHLPGDRLQNVLITETGAQREVQQRSGRYHMTLVMRTCEKNLRTIGSP